MEFDLEDKKGGDEIGDNGTSPKDKFRDVSKNIISFTLELIGDNEAINIVSMDGMEKIFSHVLRYIYNNTILSGITTREEFDKFLHKFVPSDMVKIAIENGEKIMNDYDLKLTEGPIYDYFFGEISTSTSTSTGTDGENSEYIQRIRNINYAVGCIEFLCCNVLFSFKDKTMNEIEKRLTKPGNEMLMVNQMMKNAKV